MEQRYGTEVWNGSFKEVWNGGMERGYGTGVVPDLVPDIIILIALIYLSIYLSLYLYAGFLPTPSQVINNVINKDSSVGYVRNRFKFILVVFFAESPRYIPENIIVPTKQCQIPL